MVLLLAMLTVVTLLATLGLANCPAKNVFVEDVVADAALARKATSVYKFGFTGDDSEDFDLYYDFFTGMCQRANEDLTMEFESPLDSVQTANCKSATLSTVLETLLRLTVQLHQPRVTLCARAMICQAALSISIMAHATAWVRE